MNCLIIILAFLILSQSQILQCTKQILMQSQQSKLQQRVIQCLQFAFREGNFAMLKQINPLAKQFYKQMLIQKYEEEILRLNLLEDDIILEESTCEPILKWSQNMSHIFITIKASHRWDSPPCLYSKNQSSYLNQSYFYYSNTCLVSHSRLNFELKMNLYRDVKVNQKQSQSDQLLLKNDGVGTQSVILQKQQYKIWPFLNKQQTVYESWLQIAERYPNATNQYQNLLRQIIRQRKASIPKSQVFIEYVIIGLAILISI